MSRPSTAARRRGAILIAVLALLAIFAVVGISFVFYSNSEAEGARQHRDSMNRNGQRLPNPPSFDKAAELSFQAILFGDSINAAGQLNGYRGHDILSTMYGGQWSTTNATAPTTIQ